MPGCMHKRPSTTRRAESGPKSGTLEGRPSERVVGVFQAVDDFLKHGADLLFVAFHQKRILEGILRHLAQLIQVFAQHLDLLGAGNNAAIGAFPDNVHVGLRSVLGSQSAEPGTQPALRPGCDQARMSRNAAIRAWHSPSVPTVMRRNLSMRGSLKWRTMMLRARKACANSAASRCGWRAKMKLAADGSTSKPRPVKFVVSVSRVAMTALQHCSKWAVSSMAATAPTMARRSS